MNKPPTPLASTAMEAAREIVITQWGDCYPGNNQWHPVFTAIIQKHFQPLLAKVEGERDAALKEDRDSDSYKTAFRAEKKLREIQDAELTALRADLAAKEAERAILTDRLSEAIESQNKEALRLNDHIETKREALRRLIAEEDTEAEFDHNEHRANIAFARSALASRADKGGAGK